VIRIGEYAFAYNDLASIAFPNSVTKIEKYAFFMNKFTSISIPDNVTRIGRRAFAYNEINSITIGANVEIDSTPTTMGVNEGFKSAYDSDEGKSAGTNKYIAD